MSARGFDDAGFPLTNAAALTRARESLRAAGVPDPVRDARLLLAHLLSIDPGRMVLHADDPISAGDVAAFDRLVGARAAREPVSRILGHRAFFGRSFRVTPHVLDPRPETECLVDLALQEPFDRVLDIGTGSGCIALTLLAERPAASAVATDISPEALETAGENAAGLGVSARVRFTVSDWFDAVEGGFDLIVSNPPYIDPREIRDLAPEVARYDPAIALFDADDGLTSYRRLSAGAPRHLAPGGRLIVEIGPGQGAAVTDMFRAAGLQQVAIHPDLDGRDRVVFGRKAP